MSYGTNFADQFHQVNVYAGSITRADHSTEPARHCCLNGLQVDDELEFGRLQNRQLGGIRALEGLPTSIKPRAPSLAHSDSE
jgi:hypothetical protein